ncbi:hypothetical protein M0802_000456 [Mischocyttarus mexicanus]|nr:hypothetical protein M0802_000456 [Mischocyttarus mexicanus]
MGKILTERDRLFPRDHLILSITFMEVIVLTTFCIVELGKFKFQLRFPLEVHQEDIKIAYHHELHSPCFR